MRKHFVATLILTLLSNFPAANAFELTLETEIGTPLLNAANRTKLQRNWVSAGAMIGSHFLMRAEIYKLSGGFSMGSFQTGPSTNQVGSQEVTTSMLGLSIGTCYPSCSESAWRLIAGGGRAEREYSDTILGREFSTGAIWFTEIGYQWRWGNAMTGLSIASLNSDLKEAVRFDTATAHLEISKRNSEQLLKWNVGVAF